MPDLKPRSTVRVRVFLAALLWSLVGLMLLFRGVTAVRGSGLEWVLLPAVLLGTLKARFVLDRVARKNMLRIAEVGEGACLGGVYSAKTWLLVLVMIASGRLLRASSLPSWLVGFLYVAVGWALFWASRVVWAAWYNRQSTSGAA